ncbi:nuclear transport factor 2 family protein, partial [Sphingomonas parapaucimobilis]|uniref:nuclear transport factor 2 family protein n=1 Tax=Sphingomonas parapaucimobilis TaxID=28213 RepID=UPI0035C84AC6
RNRAMIPPSRCQPWPPDRYRPGRRSMRLRHRNYTTHRDTTSPAALVHAFYKARQDRDPEALRSWLADDVCWNEPVVGDHMGRLRRADAVVDMLSRALAATDGIFSLRVARVVETHNHCAAVIGWSADKNGRTIKGQDMAVFGFKDGRIAEASFFASDITNDQAFREG